jgi:GAF domain-containing protein
MRTGSSLAGLGLWKCPRSDVTLQSHVSMHERTGAQSLPNALRALRQGRCVMAGESAFSVCAGLPVPQRTVGALNLYASTPDPPAEQTISLAQAFASYAGVAVANAGPL